MMSLKDEFTFYFSNVLIISLCNSSANCRFPKISLLIADYFARVTASPENFLSKNLSTITARPFLYPAKLWIFSNNKYSNT